MLLLGIGTGARAQEPTSVDPVLLGLLRPSVRPSLQRLVTPSGATEAPSFRGAAVVVPDVGGPEVEILVRGRNPGAIDAIRAAGGVVRAQVGAMAAARVPLDAVRGLASSGLFSRMEAAQRLEPIDDSSSVAIRINTVRQAAEGRWIGFTGKGALVGIVDTGIDFRHEDFIDASGQTRVLGIWDITGRGSPPPGETYGTYCSPEMIQATITGGTGCSERDRFGHGTHVAGIAAGDGSAGSTGASDFRYAGVAPEAGILVVKAGEAGFYEGDIIAGLQWLKQRSQALGMPISVNLSLGGQYGPHDGTRLYELMIDSLDAPGYVVNVASGNDGTNRDTQPVVTGPLIHADLQPALDQDRSVTITVPTYPGSPDPCSDYVAFDTWYSGADRLAITVTRPDGTSAMAATGDTAADIAATGTIYVDNASTGTDPLNGDHEAYVEISGCGPGGGSPAPGSWKVAIRALDPPSGKAWDGWIYATYLGGDQGQGASGFDNASTVSSPGTSIRAVTVGAFVTRLCVPYATGTACSTVSEQVGDIAYFSGTGPTRDERLKPEITAPGRLIISALSRDATFPNNTIAPDHQHVALQGTSMATPHVTGAVALLMEVDPTLTPERVKQILESTADKGPLVQHTYVEGDDDGVPNYTWGYGKMDVQAALESMGVAENAATLQVQATPLQPAASSNSAAGQRIPLLALDLTSQGPEAEAVYQLGFQATGSDPGARVVVVRDDNGNGVPDPGEPVVGSTAVAIDGQASVSVPVDSLVVPANGTVHLVAAIEMSGQAPNGSSFTLAYLPDRLRSVGVESLVAWLRQQPAGPVASQPAVTTVLEGDEVFAMSENPIRSDRVYFNFRTPPDRAAIYTLSGRMVVDLRGSLSSGLRTVWRVVNGDGDPLAAGVYLLVVEVGGQRITQKLFVTGERQPTSDR